MFTFRSFGSGSSGNSYLFSTNEGSFLIDAGVSMRRIKQYLNESGTSASKLEAVILTHDHADHAKNAGALQREALKAGCDLPLYVTKASLNGIVKNPSIKKKPVIGSTRLIKKEEDIECCGCRLTPFDVPHDSEDNTGYLIRYRQHTLCFLTDVGNITPKILEYIEKAELLIIESNYDRQMLDCGPYPRPLRERIYSGNGHLSNAQAAEIICSHREKLHKVWLCHLSNNNNTPERVRQAIEAKFHETGLNITDYIQLEILQRCIASPVFDLEKQP